MTEVKTLVLLGKPGAGKGTISTYLVDKGLRACVSGDYFRDLRNRKDHVGYLIRKMYDTGALLDDAFITHLLMIHLMRLPPDERTFFDGFGRTPEQAHELHRLLCIFERAYIAVHLEVSDEIAIERMKRRSDIEHRPESDTDEKIKKRLSDYHRVSKPALEIFEQEGVLRRISSEGTVEETRAEVLKILHSA